MSMNESKPDPRMVERIRSIQQTLRNQKIDGWLFYDFWKRNEFAQRILEFPRHILNTRRFFYLIPANGEPRKLVHSIERWNIDHLPELAISGFRAEKHSYRYENSCHGIFTR